MTANPGSAKKKTRVVHMTSVHPPFDGRIFHKQCKTLRDSGYDVSLIVPTTETGLIDGVEVLPVKPVSGRLARMLLTTWQMLRQARRADAAVYHMHDPELLFVAIILKLAGKKIVFDSHEQVALQMLDKGWVARPLRRPLSFFMRAFEAVAGKVFDAVVAATPAIGRDYPDHKVTIVQNFPKRKSFAEVTESPYGLRPPVVLYLGALADIRGAREIVTAADRLPAGARLLILGSMPPDLEEELREMPGWARTDYTGWQPPDQLGRRVADARVGVVTFHPLANHVNSQPTKLFEYLAAGLPVVVSDFPHWRALVEEVGCGVVVDPMDPVAIAKALTWMLEHPDEAEAMGRRGADAAETRFNWEVEAEKLLALYEDLLA